jgi:hypothetical protein
MNTSVPANAAPRKRSRAIAKPAITEIITEMMVVTAETKNVFQNHLKYSGVLNNVS